MATDPNSELSQFEQFIRLQVQSGRSLTPEEALDLFRIEHPHPDEFDASIADLREAVAEVEAGVNGVPIEDFVRQQRARHGWSKS
ncbi:MAG: hypothetical protein K2Y37_01640 [Pirellulales bacterium]|nr:hypothetical protein [Pirellulales bacterium]